MDQLRAGRRCMRGQVVLFTEQHIEPTPGGVARDTGSVDAAANDQNVVQFAGL